MSTADSDPKPPRDPKEAMRAALEAKKAAQHGGQAQFGGNGKGKAAAHGPASTKREFRRKSGGGG